MRCGCNQKKGGGGVLGVIGRKVGGKMRGSKVGGRGGEEEEEEGGGGGGGRRRRREGGEEERGGEWVDEGR